MKTKVYLTWEQVEKFVNIVKNKYVLEEPFTGVYGLPRGGLVLAVMLSHKLNIPLLAAPSDGCLIVDDICDSGESLLHYFQNSSGRSKKRYTIATLVYKENLLGVVPDCYLIPETDDHWIVFPWE